MTNDAQSFSWTGEEIGELRRMHALKYSAARIAQELCGTFGRDPGRKAVIGKSWRLGLSTPKTSPIAPPPKVKAAAPPPAQPPTVTRRRIIKNEVMDVQEPAVQPVTDTAADRDIPLDQRRSLLQLTNETCRWPLGNGPAVWFCGSPTADCDGGAPYCPQHSARAYDRSAQRRQGYFVVRHAA